MSATALAQIDDKAFLAQFEKTFEPGGVVETSRFISAELMSGPLHNVGARAYNDGLNNTCFLYSGGSEAEVTTGLALRTRIREIYAIDSLQRMSKTEEFDKAMAAAGKQKSKVSWASSKIRSARPPASRKARRAFSGGSARG